MPFDYSFQYLVSIRFMFLQVGGATVSVSENVIKLVTNKEFKEKGKVVNLEKYDKYKEKERLKKEDDEIQVLREKKSKKEKKHKRSRSRSRSPKMKKAKTGKTWVRPELRVRCVDKRSEEYKGKLVVVDVTTAETCDCRTAQGKLIEGVRTDRSYFPSKLAKLAFNHMRDQHLKICITKMFNSSLFLGWRRSSPNLTLEG